MTRTMRALALALTLPATPALAADEMCMLVLRSAARHQLEAHTAIMPDHACQDYIDYAGRKSTFEILVSGRVIGRVERVICIRENGTAHDLNGETEAPVPSSEPLRSKRSVVRRRLESP